MGLWSALSSVTLCSPSRRLLSRSATLTATRTTAQQRSGWVRMWPRCGRRAWPLRTPCCPGAPSRPFPSSYPGREPVPAAGRRRRAQLEEGRPWHPGAKKHLAEGLCRSSTSVRSGRSSFDLTLADYTRADAPTMIGRDHDTSRHTVRRGASKYSFMNEIDTLHK
jgi:hypothetical protein